MIAVQGVHKRYGDQKVLNGVDLSIAGGTVTTIIGRSGGGKSVLLRHLIGLERPDEGEILIDGADIVGMDSIDLNKMRRRFGVLFQEGALFDSFSVRDNVAFPLREHTGLSDSVIEEIAEIKLSAVGLEEHADKFPSQISGGMRKRVGLARALALDPDIVFFDEPTAGLDPLTKASIYSLIIRAHRESSITYVMVSHDIGGILDVSDQIMMLWEGRIIAQGTPKEIVNNPDPLVQQFVTGSLRGPIPASDH